MNSEECLICNAPLEYLEKDIDMECEICHKTEKSKTRCVNGHYACNACHKKGLDTIIGVALKETSNVSGKDAHFHNKNSQRLLVYDIIYIVLFIYILKHYCHFRRLI